MAKLTCFVIIFEKKGGLIQLKFWISFSILFCFLGIYTSCTFSVDYKGGKFACSVTKDCPTDHRCVNNLCLLNGTELPDSCTDGGCNKEAEPPKPCKIHTDCTLKQSCRPNIDGQGSYCVSRCNVVTQEGCPKGEVCVLWDVRGYCREMRGKNKLGHLCTQDLDCELHLYCREVKGFSKYKRCAKTCDRKKGCARSGQQCLALRPEDDPIGYCEPLPTIVKAGEICGGDLLCKDNNYVCRKEQGEAYPHCHLLAP